MSPTAFYLTAAIAAMQKEVRSLPVSVRRAALLADLEVLREMLRRAQA